MQWLEGLATACKTTCDFDATGEIASVFVEPAWIKAAVKRIYKQGYFLEDVTCLDIEEGYLVLYHFDHFDTPGRITVRVIAERENPEVPSIAAIYQGAEWHERECMDFYPIVFKGNPNPSRLLLPDDMEEKPLAKAEGKRQALLNFFAFTDLDAMAGDNSQAAALAEKLEAVKAEAEAAAAAAAAEQAEGDAAAEEKAE